ncbi:DUF4355 domain-containing protein [uncultured Anaerococcus sp.]|uniref:DUF4355 domain-containing protein n=1 Tax=uncultured Anaerococcus sp. TaxID=293428 RepID=UPI002601126E|nr:DUF4355 domain-containing protein [uncultured Anaerococcus sp.]
MKDLLIRDISLQRFADEGEGAGQEDGQDVNQGQDAGQEEAKTYSQEELDEAVSEATKGYVSQEKLQEIIDKTIAKERKKAEEAERLSKLSEKERAEEQAKLDKQEIEELRAKLAKKDLEDDTIKELKEQELDSDFLEFVIADDAEKTLEKIKRFKPLFDRAVNQAVDERVRGKSPQGTNNLKTKKDVFSTENIGEYAQKSRII